jgi:hypothetical protein
MTSVTGNDLTVSLKSPFGLVNVPSLVPLMATDTDPTPSFVTALVTLPVNVTFWAKTVSEKMSAVVNTAAKLRRFLIIGNLAFWI